MCSGTTSPGSSTRPSGNRPRATSSALLMPRHHDGLEPGLAGPSGSSSKPGSATIMPCRSMKLRSSGSVSGCASMSAQAISPGAVQVSPTRPPSADAPSLPPAGTVVSQAHVHGVLVTAALDVVEGRDGQDAGEDAGQRPLERRRSGPATRRRRLRRAAGRGARAARRPRNRGRRWPRGPATPGRCRCRARPGRSSRGEPPAGRPRPRTDGGARGALPRGGALRAPLPVGAEPAHDRRLVLGHGHVRDALAGERLVERVAQARGRR